MDTPFVGHVPIGEAARLVGCASDPELVADLCTIIDARVVWRGRRRYVREVDLPYIQDWVWIWRNRLKRPRRDRVRPPEQRGKTP